MDGVLVDVSASYRETVRRSAALFLSAAGSGDALPEPLFPLADLAAVKQSGGLNNDWDLTRLVCALLFSEMDTGPMSTVEDAWQRYTESMAQCDTSRLSRFLKRRPSPLSTLFADEARRTNAFVDGLYSGDVGSGNVIKQIFQEIYLGKRFFENTYGLEARMYTDEGLYRHESLIIEKAALQRLRRRYVLAIATGRPAAEAALPLAQHDLASLFSLVFTLDDCLAAEKRHFESTGTTVSLSKPSPFMLDRIVERLGAGGPIFCVGDMPDDMRAAAASRHACTAVGFTAASPERDRLCRDLLAAGADVIIETPQELEYFFTQRLAR